MTNRIIPFSYWTNIRLRILGIGLTVICYITCFSTMMSQDSLSTETNQLFKSKITLSANQLQEGSIELNSLLRVKVDNVYQGISNAKITFYNVKSDGEEKALGEKITAPNGKASLIFKAADLAADADGYFSFLARFDGNEKLTAGENDLRIHPAKLTIEPIEADSTYTIKIMATADSPEGPKPIADATVGLYVKRMFSSLKVGEGTTDEEGTVEIDFPNNLPGDADANVVITALIEESEDYGSLAASVTKPWGKSVANIETELPRALWSPHPPTWMVVTFFILMGTVWGNYLIIVYKLFRIRFKKDNTHARA
ncbi:MAG: hypothetical protein IPP15_07740 [Saprospiraceae bacterium]|uniref:Uncharacterized protein n=1 Tax=Candidatus Opimibacter skivensis TaxID=2982028 RepID=A0A9D7XT23_9BACT|nr:hypothetical protein [Candidatus Opimibacter skivensis]